MSYHVARIKNIVYRKTEELLENLKSELKHPEGNLVDIRECEVRLGEYRFTMLRCFVNARDSGVFVNVGWVVNDHMDQCLLCRSFFSFFNRRHHCRACGTLVCKACSPHNAFIITMEQFGTMKVCRECYRGQGEPVPVLNTRHLGRSLKPQSKTAPANASSTAPKPAAGPQSSTISVPSTPATSPAVPPGTASKPSSGNKANGSAENRERAESESYLAPPPYLSEFPLPGYVVKTRRYATNEKVFINICHHPSILDPMLSLFNVVLPPDDVTMQEEEQRVRVNQQYRDITAASSLDSTIVPILYLNEDPDATQDKGGASSVLYWVMISSEYFKTSTLKYTSVAVVQKIIEAINKTFQDSLLEDEYVRPRVKGGMKAGVKTCHPLTASMPAPAATVNTGADVAMASFPSCPVTFLAPIRFVLNTVDVALLLRIQQGAVDARVSISDNRSVYTERTADDLELAREEDEAEQKKRFRLFFNPLPPFPRFSQNKKQSSSSSLSALQMADNASEVSDLTFVSYNPRAGGSGGRLPKASSASRLPPIPDSPHAATQKTVANGTQSHGAGGMSSSASVTGSVNGDAAGGKRFGWLATQADAKFGPNGRELLTASMLVYQKELSLNEAEVATMMAQASKLPAVLMGWQIKLEIPSSAIDDDAASVAGSSYQAPSTLSALGHVPTPTWMIFVVTGIRKNAMRKTEFRISSLLREDQWILLKRSQNKIGYDFTPLRQVLSFPK